MKREAQPMIRTTILISPEFYKLCKENFIKFSDAMRVGISICLAEKGVKEYDNKLNVYRKMLKYQDELQNALTRLYEIEQNKDIKEIKSKPKI